MTDRGGRGGACPARCPYGLVTPLAGASLHACRRGLGQALPLRKGDTIMASLNPAQLEKHLKGVNYPVTKPELVKHMERSGADQSICAAISCLPNQSYDSPAAVNRAISAMQQGNIQQDYHDQDQSQQDR